MSAGAVDGVSIATKRKLRMPMIRSCLWLMDAKIICAGSSEPEYFYILPEK
jgi:hypothetical protein